MPQSYKTNPKTSAMSALLKSDKFNKMVKEALDAPIGSTKRQRAMKLVNIMKKTRKTFDGQGGPSIPQMDMPKKRVTVPGRSDGGPLIILPSPPRSQFKYNGLRGNKKGRVFDGQGGPGFAGPPSQDYWSSVTPNQSFLGPMQSPAPAPAPTSGAGTISSTLRSVGNHLKDPGATWSREPYSWGDIGRGIVTHMRDPGNTEGRERHFVPDTPFNLQSTVGGASGPQSTPFDLKSIVGGASGPQSIPQTPLAGTMSNAQTAGSAQGAPNAVSGGGGGGAPGGGGAGAPPAAPRELSAVERAVQQGLGPGGFALQAINDPAMLRSLPGFENLPDSVLPYGTNLAGQYNDLSRVLNKEYGLDTALQQMNQRGREFAYDAARGNTLVRDLKDYIKAKDEYVNEVDGMIGDFIGKMPTMNTADPVIGAQASSYMNYLYTLKGRQNARYVEFLNGSIDQYNQQLDHQKHLYSVAQDNYKARLDRYQMELSHKHDLNLKEFEMYYNVLQNMYAETQNAPMVAMEKEMMEIQLQSARLQLAQAAIGGATNPASPNMLKMSKEFADSFMVSKWVPDPSDSNKQIEVKTFNPAFYDPNNLERQIATLAAAHGGVGAEMAARLAAQQWLGQASSNTALSESERRKAINAYNYISTGGAGEIMSMPIDPGVQNQLSKAAELLSAPTTQRTLNPLTWMKGNRGYSSRDDFVQKAQKDGLSSEIAGFAYDFYNTHGQASNDPAEVQSAMLNQYMRTH